MKFKISPFLRLFYLSVKFIVNVTFGAFYKKQHRINPQNFNTQGACIIISNHPNTMVDPLNAVRRIDAIVHFLANASLFKSAIGNWFFTTFYCIKVERPKDVGGRRINNSDSLNKSADHLTRYGTLYIAAEGTSKLERRLRKIKTGASRIAFDAAHRSDFKIDIKIFPVGLTYEDPKLARYDLLHNYAAPISILDYETLYKEDKVRAVKKLTRDIQARLQTVLLHTEPEDDDVDKLVQKLERIHKNEFNNDLAQQFPISKNWIEKLLHLKSNETESYQSIKVKINKYCDAITNHKLTDQAVQEKSNVFLTSILLVLGFIPAVLGWLNNLLAFLLPDFIIRKADMYPGYTSSVKLLLIAFFFPFTYWLQYKLVGTLALGSFVPLIYIVSTVILGFFALHYFRLWHKHAARLRWNRLKRKDAPLYEEIKSDRTYLINTVFSQLSP